MLKLKGCNSKLDIHHSIFNIFDPMFSSWQLIKKYSAYYLTASNGKGHGIHSPFVYDFVRHVLIDKRQFYAYSQVEAVRKKLRQNETVIEVEDFGAGSAIAKTN